MENKHKCTHGRSEGEEDLLVRSNKKVCVDDPLQEQRLHDTEMTTAEHDSMSFRDKLVGKQPTLQEKLELEMEIRYGHLSVS